MVPRRLKEARLAAGLSQGKLSELLGIEGTNTSSRLSSYEVGRTEPPFSLMKRIAKILDYPVTYFYAEEDDFARVVLEFHRNRANPEFNPYYVSVAEARKLSEQLEEARQLAAKLGECLKDR
jgi:transcriptional regulator with XRE-family HTH domain